MTSFACAFALTACVGGPAEAIPRTGYLVPTNVNGKRSEASLYSPKEGDLVFFDDRNPYWTILFLWAGTGPPLHVGMVVKKDDGKLAVLEAGPDDTLWVKLLDLEPRLG